MATRPLIDEFLPTYEVASHHRIEIDAPIEDVYTTVRELDFSDSGLARLILWIRNLPARVRGEPGLGLTLDDLLGLGFIMLADEPPHELVLGFAAEFWTPSGNLRTLTPDEFLTLSAPECAKAVMNFRLTLTEKGRTCLSTDSRAQCFDEASRRKFNRYMLFTDHLRGVLRQAMLRSCKRRAEAMAQDRA
jgi:hypothetical protein